MGSMTVSSTVAWHAAWWQRYNVPLAAAGSLTFVALAGGDPLTDNVNGLDDVTLPLGGLALPVPEPGILRLLASGMAVALLLRRRGTATKTARTSAGCRKANNEGPSSDRMTGLARRLN